MKTSTKVLITTLVVAVPAFALAATSPAGEGMWRAMWPWDEPAGEQPTGILLPLFMMLGVFEAVALGLAISFLVYGRHLIAKLAAPGWRFNALYFGVAWALGNWWFHDSLHMITGFNLAGLLIIEYAFHVTLIIAGGLVALALVMPKPASGKARSTTPTSR